ncbi:MAG: hypothetical protein LKI30_03150 [Bifidobacterium crudilactis]|jgi:hypothetical protein|nr:hypothetical protein [Bifidobacterium crudilactis]
MQNDDCGYCDKSKKKIIKDYRNFEKDMQTALRLLGDKFCPETQAEPVKPGKLLYRITSNESYAVWKFDVAVAGARLRPGQWPRLWFGVVEKSRILVPLVVARHKDYGEGDSKQENEALALMKAYSLIEES